jgi:hypothetical protein
LSSPGSRLSTARSTEASRTILFISGRLAPFCNQLIDQRRTWFNVLADEPLRSLDAAFQRGDPQLVIFDPQNDFIPDIDAKGFAKCGGDNDSAIFVDAQASF